MRLKVIIERGVDGYFVAHCPSLKICWSQGKTEDEALRNIKEAIELYLEPDEDIVESETVKGYYGKSKLSRTENGGWLLRT